MSRKHRFQVMVDKEQYEKLVALARKKQVSVSAFVRVLVAKRLEFEEKKQKNDQ